MERLDFFGITGSPRADGDTAATLPCALRLLVEQGLATAGVALGGAVNFVARIARLPGP